MYALIFTNTILGAYLSYIIAERRKHFFRDRVFWLILFLLITSLAVTLYTLAPTESVTSVKKIMLP